MTNVLLEIENLSHQYPDGTMALQSVSLTIEKGKKIALLGNNGAGKSTLFLHLNAILQPTSGKMYYKGKPFTYKRKEKQKLRADVGVVFQDPETQLFSSSVYDDIQYGPLNMGLPKEQVEKAVQRAMELTETESLKDKPPHFLSIGQKKRAAIATVLSMNPSLLILDEPTAGLDPYYSNKILHILDEVSSEERTIIISTHDIDFAFEWADEIWVISGGRLIAQDFPVQVFQNKEVLEKSHLRLPWVLEVFEQMAGQADSMQPPNSKEELFALLHELLPS